MSRVYKLSHPSKSVIELDITSRVQKGVSNLTELSFAIDRVTTPSAGSIECENSDGLFDTGQGFFADELTNYVVTIEEDGRRAFVGIMSDIEYKRERASLKIASAVQKVVQASIPKPDFGDYTFTGTPAAVAKDILLNQVVLPGLFVDSLAFDVLDLAEQDRSIEIDVNIPESDKVSLGDFLQELYKTTGLYVFSQNGVLTAQRVGNFGADQDPDYLWRSERLLSEKLEKRRPILWQKTRAIVPSASGPVAKNMTDFYATGETIIEAFKEKTLESDGLGGKIEHTTVASADECLQDILGWRGFIRHEVKFSINIIDEIGRAAIQQAPLFSAHEVETSRTVARGILVEKKLFEDRAELTMLTVDDPKNLTYSVLDYPWVVNYEGRAAIVGRRHIVQYFLEGQAVQEVELDLITGKAILIDNPGHKPLYVRSRLKNGFISDFSRWFRADHGLRAQEFFTVEIDKIGVGVI